MFEYVLNCKFFVLASSKEEDEEDKENGDLSNDSKSETEEKDLEDEHLLKESGW